AVEAIAEESPEREASAPASSEEAAQIVAEGAEVAAADERAIVEASLDEEPDDAHEEESDNQKVVDAAQVDEALNDEVLADDQAAHATPLFELKPQRKVDEPALDEYEPDDAGWVNTDEVDEPEWATSGGGAIWTIPLLCA